MAEEIMWLAVTTDELELPIAMGETKTILANTLGVSISCVCNMAKARNISKYKYMGEHYKIVRVITGEQ